MQSTATIRSVSKATDLRSDWRFQLRRPSWLQLISLLIIALVMIPLIYLVIRALGAGQEGIAYLLKERTLRIVSNSVLLVVLVTVSATLIGVPFAWLTTRTDLPLRRVWLVLGLLTMVIPSYLGAVTYIAAFGPKGLLQSLLEVPFGVERLPDIRGLFGAWMSITLFTYPYVVLPVRAALLNTDPALKEAARSLGLKRRQVFLRVTLPQLRPAIAAGTLLVALYTLSDFGAVAVMRYNAFTRAIFLQYTSSFNRERAAILALILIALTLILLIMERRANASTQNYRIGTGAKRVLPTSRLGKWKLPALIFCAVLVGIGVMIPVMVLFTWITTRVHLDSVPVAMSQLMNNTVSVSGVAAFVTALAAIPLAILAVRSSTRLNRILVGLSYTGYVLPGIVIGLALVFFASNYALDLYRTIPLLILGYAIRFLPLSISTTRSALTQIPPRLEEAARSLGLNSWQVIWRITIPLARTGIIAGAALVFLNVMKELPITLILSPAGFRTFSTRIWSMYEEAMLALVGQPGLLLILASAAALAILLWRDHTESS